MVKLKPSVLYRIERCLQTVNVEQIEQISQRLKCPIAELLALEEYESTNPKQKSDRP